MKAVSSKQMREIERIAIEELGIPSILLMENAAIRLAEHCFRVINGKKNPKVLIVSGSGNNGGDGMALARHLYINGIETKVIYIGNISAAKGDAATYLTIIRKLGVPLESIQPNSDLPGIQSVIETCDLVVDAIFGIGLDRNVEGNYKHIIEIINNYAKYVISVDIPSGVHSDNGQIMGCAVKAAETITFSSPKIGAFVYPGAAFAGKVHVEDITIPSSLINRIKTEAEILTDKEVKELLPVRRRRSNKGDFGKIMVFAGSNEMPGAAALTCSGAYMTGCGLVNACVLPHVAAIIHKWQREVITHTVPEINGMYCKKSIGTLAEEINRAGVLVIGPGIGRSPDVTEFVQELITMAEVPMVLDADALFAVSENVNILKQKKAPCIITPHPGEMNRLTGVTVTDILENTIDIALRFSKEFNVVTLLKDAHTIIANPNGNFNINTTGNNALSKAGTGDVLTGMIAGFIAQGSDAFTAGILGAYFHGKSGEAAAMNKSKYGVTATDLLNHIPLVMK